LIFYSEYFEIALEFVTLLVALICLHRIRDSFMVWIIPVFVLRLTMHIVTYFAAPSQFEVSFTQTTRTITTTKVGYRFVDVLLPFTNVITTVFFIFLLRHLLQDNRFKKLLTAVSITFGVLYLLASIKIIGFFSIISICISLLLLSLSITYLFHLARLWRGEYNIFMHSGYWIAFGFVIPSSFSIIAFLYFNVFNHVMMPLALSSTHTIFNLISFICLNMGIIFWKKSDNLVIC
jgi:hypothetical protein